MRKKGWQRSAESVALVLGALLLPFAQPASAQTQAQVDRANQIADYGMRLAVCERLGMKLAPDAFDRMVDLAAQEAATWGLPKGQADAVLADAVRRHGQMFKLDLDAAAAKADSEAELRRLSKVLADLGRDCPAMLHDPIFSQVLSAPAGFDLQSAAKDAADALLADGGLASWQTPDIQARGDLMMLAGTCRQQIGAARSDELVAKYGRSDDIRERAYYLRSFDTGLADTELIFTRAQCDRAIRANQAKLAARP
jgi:hypothetical protein